MLPRREFLRGLSALSVFSLAGCSDDGEGTDTLTETTRPGTGTTVPFTVTETLHDPSTATTAHQTATRTTALTTTPATETETSTDMAVAQSDPSTDSQTSTATQSTTSTTTTTPTDTMTDQVFWQDGDAASPENLSQLRAQTNSSDYVERGLSFTPDYTNNELDISTGHAVIYDSANDRAYDVFPDARTNLALTDAATNYVYLMCDPDNVTGSGVDDDVGYHIDTDDTPPTATETSATTISVKVGEVDTSADTKTAVNRDPAVTARSVDTDKAHIKDGEPWFDVKAYGAVGDGQTIDTDAMMAAIGAAEDAGGGTVFVPPGVYLVDTSITEGTGKNLTWATPNIRLIGAGWDSVIKLADNATLTDEGASIIDPGPQTEIAHLQIDGNWQNNTPISDANDGANILELKARSSVHHVYSRNSTGDGVEILDPDCQIHDNLLENNWEQGVHIWNDHCVVHNNIITGTENDGSIRWYSGTNKKGDCYRPKITDNIIIGGKTSGIQLKADSGLTCYYPTITGNTIIDAGQEGSSSADNSTTSGIELRQATGATVADNVIVNAAAHGIDVHGTCDEPAIRSNRVHDSGSVGIRVITLAAKLAEPEVADNDVRRSQNHGILLKADSYDILDPVFRSNTVVDNNQADTSYSGIYVDGATNGIFRPVITGNVVNSTGTIKHSRGVMARSGTGVVQDIDVRNNRVKNVVNAAYAIGGEDVAYVRENVPAVTIDVRSLTAEAGNQAYHDGTNTNTVGPAFYDGGAAAWKSLVDGTTIS